MKKPDYITHNLSSNGIDLKRLERETYKLLFIGFIAAILFHAGLIFIFPAGETKVADRNSIQVELVKIKPRIIMPSPIISSKNTTHEIYRFRRKTAASVPLAPNGLKNPSGIDYGKIKINTAVTEISQRKTIDAMPDSILAQEISLRMPKDKIPFSSNIFVDKGDIQSSKSMIIAPPGNKMAIQGYTHIASIQGEEFSPQDTLLHAFESLANAVKYYTNIDAKYDSRIELSNAISKYPLIYLCYDKPFELTKEEGKLLAGYIISGGFIIIDNPLHESDGGDVGNSLKNAITHAFFSIPDSLYAPVKEKIYSKNLKTMDNIPSRSIKPLPKNHELFHCFFDFNDGPPKGYQEDSGTKNVIEGIYVSERLVGFYLTGYGLLWNDKRNEEQLKMGVNMVVYALKRGKGHYNYFSGEMVRIDKNNAVKEW